MARVFVFGARIPTAGAFMAYHLGRILHRHFGYALFDVEVFPVRQQIFQYDIAPENLPLADLQATIRDDDVLIANPSFSDHMLGLKMRGRKVMYVQDFKTFTYLDCHFDHYVSVSGVVQKFLAAVYGIKAPVIPPFIQINRMPAARPWRERPPRSIVVYVKRSSPEHLAVLDFLHARFAELRPDIPFNTVLKDRGLRHQEFMETLAAARYAMVLSIAEGFGLVPLEAMALGCTVTGLDGIAGLDYMRPGENCLCLPFRDVKALPQALGQLMDDEPFAERLAGEGIKTAQRYGYAQFKSAWIKQFSAMLGVKPNHV